MPDLGKATYTLVLNTAQFNAGLAQAEARATAATNKIASSVSRADAALMTMGTAAERSAAQVSAGSGSATRSFQRTGAAASRAAAQVEAGEAKMAGAGARMATGAAASQRSIASRMGTAGAALQHRLTVPILAVGAGAIWMSIKFQKAMTNIRALVGASRTQMKQYETGVKNMARTLPLTPEALAKGLYFVTSSGFKGAQALNVLRASAKASAAGLGDVETVADAVTSAMSAYRGSNMGAADAAGILIATIREGKGEPSELAAAIGRVIAPAQAMGVEFHEVGGALASLSLVGLDFAEGTTAIRGSLMGIMKPTQETRKFLKAHGEDLNNIRRNIRDKGLVPELTRLATKFKGNQDAIGTLFPNVRALNGFLALTGKNSGQVQKIMGALAKTTEKDLNKALAQAAKDPMFKMQLALNKLRLAAIDLGNVMLPVVIRIVQRIGQLADKFANLSPHTRKLIIMGALTVAALGPVLRIVGNLSRVMYLMGNAMRALGSIRMIGIFAIGAALYLLYTRSEKFRAAVNKIAAFFMAHPKLGMAAALATVILFRKALWSTILVMNGMPAAGGRAAAGGAAAQGAMRGLTLSAIRARLALTAVQTGLLGLIALGGTVIAIELVIHRKEIHEFGQNFAEQHTPGFLKNLPDIPGSGWGAALGNRIRGAVGLHVPKNYKAPKGPGHRLDDIEGARTRRAGETSMSPAEIRAQARRDRKARIKAKTDMLKKYLKSQGYTDAEIADMTGGAGKGTEGIDGAQDTNLLPIGLRLEEANAGLNDSKRLGVLRKENAYLQQLKAHTKNKSKLLDIQNEINRVGGDMKSITDTAESARQDALAKRREKDKKEKDKRDKQREKEKAKRRELWTPKMLIAKEKAERTEGVTDDLKVWNAERTQLIKRLKNKHLELRERARIEHEMTGVAKKIKSLNEQKRKREEDERRAKYEEMQSVRNMRGSWFAQFAPSIFHAGPGGLELGSSRGGNATRGRAVVVHQNNHYHEIPKDRHHSAKQLRRLTAGALS